ncbi:alpha/beta-hydrolase [Coccomyxa subellipsoidea C-169]|uniref:Alpha/beta-hydrolase n=1 Tax=Coccomyxa subellipsoidea (strain C-169) TaxID=574566 RepID=I0YTP5_COCSC|nr:alpha/beta-hydrolase [Coccomyxa subellipsoidea C-169]EIE21764.1 alpha/beta-hydrolase [Coccomyxa subellipsoidea C-169]|eukprot:XP_005646308.1 alpha/beta-hydrolase [Coccomyxa subellipsoidea C-169]
MTHRQLGVNGIKVHTVTTGSADKPLMLLLHGSPELWGMREHQLSHFREDNNVAAIDMRGYGESSRPGDPRDYYIDRLVQDVVDVVHELGYKTCVLVGHDWVSKPGEFRHCQPRTDATTLQGP